jgi:hypothetical protein
MRQNLIVFVAFVCFFVSGCQQEINITFTDLSNFQFPEICLSSMKECQGTGVNFSFLEFVEVDNKGDIIQRMWAVKSHGKSSVKRIKYGTLDDGYEEISKAIPLQLGHIYAINNAVFFVITKKGNEVEGHEVSPPFPKK